MSTTSTEVGLPGLIVRVAIGAAVGALCGVAFELGSALSVTTRGAVLGGSIGFGLASVLYVTTTARRILTLSGRVNELETRDRLTGLPNGVAMRTWLERHLPHANEIQSHTRNGPDPCHGVLRCERLRAGCVSSGWRRNRKVLNHGPH